MFTNPYIKFELEDETVLTNVSYSGPALLLLVEVRWSKRMHVLLTLWVAAHEAGISTGLVFRQT